MICSLPSHSLDPSAPGWQGIEAARKVFMQARKAAQCSHHVFTASALMELHVNKDPKVAFNIFSLGMKQFGANPDYVCAFLDFLLSQNDHASSYFNSL
jgi:cleavage stimulation factor subunit 3